MESPALWAKPKFGELRLSHMMAWQNSWQTMRKSAAMLTVVEASARPNMKPPEPLPAVLPQLWALTWPLSALWSTGSGKPGLWTVWEKSLETSKPSSVILRNRLSTW